MSNLFENLFIQISLILIVVIIIFALFIWFASRLNNYNKDSHVNLFKYENKFIFDWYINYSIHKKDNIVDTSLIFTSNDNEFLRLKNPTNIGKYLTTENFIYKNINFDEKIDVVFEKNYLVNNSKIKTKIIFKTSFEPSLIFVNKFYSSKTKNDRNEVVLDINYFDPKIISKFSVFFYKSDDVETERPLVKNITNFKKHYSFSLSEQYYCVVLQILFNDNTNRHSPIQSVDKILYL
ncbi:MAG: hypothetical protein GQ557_00210 [Mycoplasmataceae bacterium]|nr:hypothetical protein [Mycoplasmataceae bacterium]